MKFCKVCGLDKPLSDYYNKRLPSGNAGHSAWCKECTKQNHRDIYASPEGKERLRNNDRRSKYGIEKEHYTGLLKEQNGLCAICGHSLKTKCCVDHNHATGQIRGLLCDSCNRGLGLLKDSVSVLGTAIDYLKRNGSYGPSSP